MSKNSLPLKEVQEIRRDLHAPVEEYTIHCDGVPMDQSIELCGPASGLRFQLHGHPDFFSIAELVKSLQRPGMSDAEKALAVYRFSSRYTYHMSMGFGAFEMTRFLNCYGYSFCWGQADFQHLLYEAMGLRVRSPKLKGHSSVEVLLDGRWTTWDGYTRSLHPSPDLEHIATGAELRKHPELINAVFSKEMADRLNDYWSEAEAGTDSYEPWQDSQIMFLGLRRNERLRLDLERRDAWCLAPEEPKDFTNGRWNWTPILDETHLEKEVETWSGVLVVPGGLMSEEAGEVQYRLRSPYPFVRGELAARLSADSEAKILVSGDGRRTWTPPARNTVGDDVWQFTPSQMSVGRVPPDTAPADLQHSAVHELFIRIQWSGSVLSQVEFSLDVQAHARSLPAMTTGTNRWRIIGGDQGATVIHRYRTWPELTVSDYAPLSGETVVLSVELTNTSDRPVNELPIRFTQRGTDTVLGQTVVRKMGPGEKAAASIEWNAQAIGDRLAENNSGDAAYVHTRVVAEIGGSGYPIARTAETRLTVRPRPWPRITDDLVQLKMSEGKCLVRAALANMPPELIGPRRYCYIVDTPLSATLRLWCGHPDRGGALVDKPVELSEIQPAEFKVAQWVLAEEDVVSLNDGYLEIVCGDEVQDEHRRLILRVPQAL